MSTDSSASAARVVSTIVIWGLFTTIMGFVTLGGKVNANDIIWIVLVLAAAAAISTRSVWRGSEVTERRQFDESSKPKREVRDAKQRLARTLNALDDEEAAALLEDFKSRLAGGDSDGELSAVEMLRAERNQRS